MERYAKTSRLMASAEDLCSWHGRPGSLERLMPPWQKSRLLRRDEGLAADSRTEMLVDTPLGVRRWMALHTEYEDGRFFVDEQESGPFHSWRHRHSFEPKGKGQSLLTDEICYELSGGKLATSLAGSYVSRQLENAFSYRHAITAADLALYSKFKDKLRQKILLAGGSGFLGTSLSNLLRSQGHDVAVLTRRPSSEADIAWDPRAGLVDAGKIEGFDTVINLAGESLASGRWTKARKKRLWNSRVETTRFLVETLARLKRPPRSFISASGVGYYGAAEGSKMSEKATHGKGFLAELCVAWENEARKAEAYGSKVILLRTGVVLSPNGGALATMLRPFKLGLGGKLGSGAQSFPWISLEDWLHGVYSLIMDEEAKGPYNLVAPSAATNAAFTRVLGAALHRPVVCHVPRFALKALLGEMAEEMLLSGQRAEARRLMDEVGYDFRYRDLRDALGFMLGS